MDNYQPTIPRQRPVRVYSASSRLRHPRRFWVEAWQDLRASSDFARCLFWQSIVRNYRYSSLGILWAFVPSALIAAALTFSQGSGIALFLGHKVPPQVYAIFGIVMAQSFLESLNTQRLALSQYLHLLSRQKVPIEGLMVAGLAESTFGLMMRLPVLVIVFLAFQIPPSVTTPLLLLGMIVLIGLGAGVGLLLAPWNALSKDLDNIMQFFPWFLFLVTPVFITIPPDNWLYKIQRLNPLTYIFEATRLVAYGDTVSSGLTLVLFIPLTLLLLISGWLFCRLCLPYVIESHIN